MSILEIIQLRTTEEPVDALCTDILAFIADAGRPTGEILVYRQGGLISDIAVHIRGDQESGTVEPSEFGRCLASVLEVFGLVKHTVWLAS